MNRSIPIDEAELKLRVRRMKPHSVAMKVQFSRRETCTFLFCEMRKHMARSNVKPSDLKNTVSLYRRYTAGRSAALLSLLALAFCLSVLCVNAGSAHINPVSVVKAFFGLGDEKNILIVWNIRMPRVLAAVIAGAGLSLSGCVMQNVLKNPMASPSTLGVSNAAVFGANFAIIVLGAGSFHSTHGNTLTIENPYLVTILAFACAMGSVFLILGLSRSTGFSPETVVLAGIALGSILSAGTTIIQYFAMDTQVAAAVFWTFGDLGRASMKEDVIMLCVVSAAFLYFFLRRWDYNALANGEEVARSLGVRTRRVRFWSLLIASMITAVCVSFLGIIGFVGLVAPQAVKRFTGADYRFLLPASALAGTSLLLLSDTVARALLTGVALPVGAVTSLLGGPVFLFMLLRKKARRA